MLGLLWVLTLGCGDDKDDFPSAGAGGVADTGTGGGGGDEIPVDGCDVEDGDAPVVRLTGVDDDYAGGGDYSYSASFVVEDPDGDLVGGWWRTDNRAIAAPASLDETPITLETQAFLLGGFSSANVAADPSLSHVVRVEIEDQAGNVSPWCGVVLSAPLGTEAGDR